jgi:vacuolar-type H+-ATPase subunit E/Vma4
LVAAANERAREVEAAATKRTQEIQAAANEREEHLRADREKTLQDSFDGKNKRIEQAVLYYVLAQVQSR